MKMSKLQKKILHYDQLYAFSTWLRQSLFSTVYLCAKYEYVYPINTFSVYKSQQEQKAENPQQECTEPSSLPSTTWDLSFNPKRQSRCEKIKVPVVSYAEVE